MLATKAISTIGQRTKSYERAVRQSVNRMQADNERENRPLTANAIKRVLRQTASACHPELSGNQIDNLVERILPHAMQSYKGKPIERPAVIVTARDAYEAERRRIVKANSQRRR